MNRSEVAVRSPKSVLLIVGGLLLGGVAACGGLCLVGGLLHHSESFRWDEAQREAKLAKYEAYLQDFPDGAHRDEARRRADELVQKLRESIAGDPAAACNACLLVLHELEDGSPERVKVYLGLLEQILAARRKASDAQSQPAILELALADLSRLPRPRLRLSQRDSSPAERRGEFNTLYAANFLRELRAVEVVTENNSDPAAGAGEDEVAMFIDFSIGQTGPYLGGDSGRDMPRMRNITATLSYFPPGAKSAALTRNIGYQAADSYSFEGQPANYQMEEDVWNVAIRSVHKQLANELSLRTIVLGEDR